MASLVPPDASSPFVYDLESFDPASFTEPERDVWLRPNPELDEERVLAYAITFNGYEYVDKRTGRTLLDDLQYGWELLERYRGAESGDALSFIELRVLLFFVNRAGHWDALDYDEMTPLLRDLNRSLVEAWERERGWEHPGVGAGGGLRRRSGAEEGFG